MSTYVAVWPIGLDGLDYVLRDLVQVAEIDLLDMLHDDGAELTGPADWRIDHDQLGAPYLTMTAPAVPWSPGAYWGRYYSGAPRRPKS